MVSIIVSCNCKRIIRIHVLKCSDLTIATLLRSHRVRNLPIDSDENRQSIVVRRRLILQDTVHFLKGHFDPRKYISITFVGESAVDKGGPLREFFHILVKRIFQKNTIFCGPAESRCIFHNGMELDKKTYYYVGTLLGLSLIYGGPAPAFFLSINCSLHSIW